MCGHFLVTFLLLFVDKIMFTKCFFSAPKVLFFFFFFFFFFFAKWVLFFFFFFFFFFFLQNGCFFLLKMCFFSLEGHLFLVLFLPKSTMIPDPMIKTEQRVSFSAGSK